MTLLTLLPPLESQLRPNKHIGRLCHVFGIDGIVLHWHGTFTGACVSDRRDLVAEVIRRWFTRNSDIT
jgi:hypothetical protein